MHPNPIYRKFEREKNVDFARSRGFGILAVNGLAEPLMAHVPFLLSEDGSTVLLHLVRSNHILRLLDTLQPAKIVVSGPDSYVSPDWYGLDDQVPTWNYVAVHLTGTLEKLDADQLLPLLDAESEFFEQQLLPKPVWTTSKMTPDVLARMMRQIVPCKLTVTEIDATWKLNQNKAPAVRQGAIDGISAHGVGHEVQSLADMMAAALRDDDTQV